MNVHSSLSNIKPSTTNNYCKSHPILLGFKFIFIGIGNWPEPHTYLNPEFKFFANDL